MAIARFRGVVLPEGEPADLYVVDGRITHEAQPGADTVAEGWIVPGLVAVHGVCWGCSGRFSLGELADVILGGRRGAPSGTCASCSR